METSFLKILFLATIISCASCERSLEFVNFKVPASEFVESVRSTIDIARQVISVVSQFSDAFGGDIRLSNAVSDCLDLMDLSVDQLSWTLSASHNPNGSGQAVVRPRVVRRIILDEDRTKQKHDKAPPTKLKKPRLVPPKNKLELKAKREAKKKQYKKVKFLPKDDYPTLNTRSTPRRPYDAVRSMNERQKQSHNRRPKRSALLLQNGVRLRVPEDDVRRVLGFPNGKREIELLKRDETTNVYEQWKDGGSWSKLHFMILVSTSLIKSYKHGEIFPYVMRCLEDIHNIGQWNWAKYVISSMYRNKRTWAKHTSKIMFIGPAMFMVVSHADRLHIFYKSVETLYPLYINWTSAKLRARPGDVANNDDHALRTSGDKEATEEEAGDQNVETYAVQIMKKLKMYDEIRNTILVLIEAAPDSEIYTEDYKNAVAAAERSWIWRNEQKSYSQRAGPEAMSDDEREPQNKLDISADGYGSYPKVTTNDHTRLRHLSGPLNTRVGDGPRPTKNIANEGGSNQKMFGWDETLYSRAVIYKAWKKIAQVAYSDHVSTIKKYLTSGLKLHYLDDDIGNAWLAKWEELSMMLKSARVSRNRRSEPAGPDTGRVTHHDGSRSSLYYAEDLAREKNIPIQQATSDTFVRLHYKDGKYTDGRSQRHRVARDKKGHIFGLGQMSQMTSVGGASTQSTHRSPGLVPRAEVEQLRKELTLSLEKQNEMQRNMEEQARTLATIKEQMAVMFEAWKQSSRDSRSNDP